uniref:Titin n=1 Tax=Cynoglossus semilaevis TaxID=244447 RepID=A0A3P8X0Z2_CYNSE
MKAYQVIASECANTSFKVSGLEEDIAYFFRVSAENEYGVGDTCETSEPVRATETPGGVKDLVMVDSTHTSVTLQWSKPDHDGGSLITDYLIEKRPKEDPTWTLGATCKRCSCEVTGLKENTEMFFRVFAKNEKGLSDFTQIGPVKVINFIIPPEANLSDYPNGELAVRVGQNIHIELPFKGKPKPAISWLKDNFPLKESDTVRFRTTDNKTSVTVRGAKKEDAGQYTLVLDNRTIKNFFDINVITLGPPSITWSPDQVANLKAGENLKLSCSISGRPVPQVVWYKDGKEIDKRTMIDIEITSGIGTSSLFIRDVNRNHRGIYTIEAKNSYGTKRLYVLMTQGSQQYFLTWYFLCRSPQIHLDLISAVNGSGQGEASVLPHSVQALDRLTSPEIDIAANFKQTHTVKNGGLVCLSINFFGKPTPLATWSKVNGELPVMADINTTDSSSTLRIESCTRYDAGKYTLSLENNSGHKSITFTVKVLDTPGPPGAITFKDVTCGALTLLWDAPINDGGSRIQHYIVDKREASRLTWQEVSTKCIRQMIRVTGLDIGVPYIFRVIAVNQYGQGEPREMIEPVTATEEPASPKRLDIVDTSNSTASLVWLKPEHDGGSRIRNYIVEFRAKGTDNWVLSGETKLLKMLVEGLIHNTEYDFRVKAQNDAGISEPQCTHSSVVIKEPVIEPTADLSSITNQLIACKLSSNFTIDIPISGRPAPKKIVQVHKGRPIDLTIPFKAKPQAECSWVFNGLKLMDTLERIKIDSTGTSTHLVIRETTINDSGDYILKVKNAVGEATEIIKVIILGKENQKTVHKYRM